MTALPAGELLGPSIWPSVSCHQAPFRDLLGAILPEMFESTVRAGVDAASEEPLPEAALRLALDTKTLCSTLQPHQRAVYLRFDPPPLFLTHTLRAIKRNDLAARISFRKTRLRRADNKKASHTVG